MSTDPQDLANTPTPENGSEISERRLWFGFIASFIAWCSAGCLDVMVVWACAHQEEYGVPPPHPLARVVFGLLAVVLLVLSLYSGIVSFRNWQKLSARAHQKFLDSQAVERREYMAVLGVIITVTVGMGIVWLALPPIFLEFCWRVR
jgi:hypothetical protein